MPKILFVCETNAGASPLKIKCRRLTLHAPTDQKTGLPLTAVFPRTSYTFKAIWSEPVKMKSSVSSWPSDSAQCPSHPRSSWPPLESKVINRWVPAGWGREGGDPRGWTDHQWRQRGEEILVEKAGVHIYKPWSTSRPTPLRNRENSSSRFSSPLCLLITLAQKDKVYVLL